MPVCIFLTRALKRERNDVGTTSNLSQSPSNFLKNPGDSCYNELSRTVNLLERYPISCRCGRG